MFKITNSNAPFNNIAKHGTRQGHAAVRLHGFHLGQQSPENVNFLASRTPTPPEPKEKKRKVTSYYRASGVCITEDRIFMKIICAEEERKKTKAAKGKGKNSKKSSCDASKGESSGKSNRRLFAHPDDSDIEDEDQNPCCVCHQNTPPHPPQMNLEIFSWVACDFQGCNHWVHQKYCSGTNHILGEDDTYNCPCH